MTAENRPNGNGDTTLLARPGGKGALCAKCDHVNRPGASKCSRCGSHLYVKCRECGAHTERFRSKCQECGRRLHRSFVEKMNARIFQGHSRITPLQVALLLIFAALAFYCVIMIEQLKLPSITK